jgi:anti-sigma regulatory factor (Ser/Thr protein kinase)
MQGQREAVSQRARAENWARPQWWRVFPGEDRQLRVLREWLRGLLPACMARDDVIAVASELGANAVCHTTSGRGGQFSVEVAWTGSVVSIVVGDGGGPGEPRVIDGPESENGRGLRLVRALSLTVGVTGDERGRFVRADVPWAARFGPEPHELAWDRETAGDLRML